MKQASLFALVENQYTINCDGACRGNPGPGGYGVVILNHLTSELIELQEGEALTTNNQQELKAAIAGLKALPRGARATVRTDSQYVIKGLTEWMPGWKRRGWKTANGEPVRNRELWEALEALRAHYQLTWEWVKGHAGDPGNERADKLANLAVDRIQGKG